MSTTRRQPPHPDAESLLASLPPEIREILDEAQRAPSAHNAQPWRLHLDADDPTLIELRYDHTEYLPFDPEDRDAMLCLGAYVETLAFSATRRGMGVSVDPIFDWSSGDLAVCRVRLRATEYVDPAERLLAVAAADRHTHRGSYRKQPLPDGLVEQLEDLGCVLVRPPEIARTVARASVLSWRDRRFVTDLDAWTRADENAPDGMTPVGLGLARYEWLALRLAFWAGRLPAPLAMLFASRDVRLLRTAPAVAVMTTDGLTPAELFEAGRRLLRAWVAVGAAGCGSHPISISVDRSETRPMVRELADGREPVAVFRVGVPKARAPRSNRVPLSAVLRPATSRRNCVGVGP